MNVFKEPAAGTPCIEILRVTDGPFTGWKLEKLTKAPKRIYSTPPRPQPVDTPGASTSRTPSTVDARLDKMEKAMKKEHSKSKKFRAYLIDFLQGIAKCMKPQPKNLPSWSSSSDSDEDDDTPAPPVGKGKGTAFSPHDSPQELSSDDEEEARSEEDDSDEDDDQEDDH